MVIVKNAPITDYFKKLNQAQTMKRAFPHDGLEESRQRTRRRPSSMTKADVGDQNDSTVGSRSKSDQGFQSPGGTRAIKSDQQPSPSQYKLPTRTLPIPVTPLPITPNDHVEPERPPSSSLSPALDSDMIAEEPRLASPASTVEDTTHCEVKRSSPSVSPVDKTIPQNDAVLGSQPVFTSSQRIVRDGETMIRNSDDESDDSLEDLDNLFKISRNAGKSPRHSGPPTPQHEEVGVKTRRKIAKATPPCEANAPQSIAPRKFKYSLEMLAKQRKKDEKAKEDTARAQELYESIEQRTESDKSKKRVLDADFIETVMKAHGDDDDIGRLKTAIQRTEALEQGKLWSFFDQDAEDTSSQLTDFPAVEDERLRRLFGQNLSRQQTFLSGYAGEYATKVGLPEEIMLWIMDAVCVESRDDLRYSYITTLSMVGRYLTPLLTPEYITNLFQKLGATAAAADIQSTAVPHIVLSRTVETADRPNLMSMLVLLGRIAGDLTADSRIHLLNTLCRVALDHSIAKDCHAISALEDAIANLIESIPEDSLKRELQTVLTTVYHTISDATLRLQLLHMIPAWSSRLLLLRQRLALAFFFQDSRYLSKPSENLVDLKAIIRRLGEPQFQIRRETDFGELAASIGILSIGIDCGDPPVSPASKEEDAAFNKDVDGLSSRINHMFSDIVDTGASHMKRTEAKEVLEGFQRRLEYSIRTRPKRKLIFGNAEVIPVDERITKFMETKPREV